MSKGMFDFTQQNGNSKDFSVGNAFTIKRDSMPKDVFEPTKPDVNRESLHRLPTRVNEHKNLMYKQVQSLKKL
jgi:hypothetical protein|tara:strand:+ start:199 stop:417 length:219 start_codon:yes stop_codon:yes gene_type:complete